MKLLKQLLLMGGFAGFCMRLRQTRQAFRRVQMGGLVAWVVCMGGLRDGVGMGGFINISVNV